MVISAYLLVKRAPIDDMYESWWPEPRLTDEVGTVLYQGSTPLAETWVAPGAKFARDAVLTDVAWFDNKLLMLHNESGDSALREVLSFSGEWLPLAGQAEDWSVHHPLHSVELNEELCERLESTIPRFLGPVTKWSFDQSTVIPGTLVRIIGLGLVWFEDDTEADSGLRSVVKGNGLTGVGFVKCWDDSDSYQMDLQWRRKLRNGDEGVWS